MLYLVDKGLAREYYGGQGGKPSSVVSASIGKA